MKNIFPLSVVKSRYLQLFLPEGQVAAGICGMHHLLAVSPWLGIFHIFSLSSQLFDGLRYWSGWAFSDSSVQLTIQEK